METSHTLYRDGGVHLTIKVWLRNKHEVLSEVFTKTITTSTVNLRKIANHSEQFEKNLFKYYNDFDWLLDFFLTCSNFLICGCD